MCNIRCRQPYTVIGVNDTNGQIAACVVDTVPVVELDLELQNFSEFTKLLEMALMAL